MYVKRPNIRWCVASVLGAASFFAGSLHAQNYQPAPTTVLNLGVPQSGVVTIQSDLFFRESIFGKRVAQEIEAEGAVLTAENRRIEADLREEEQDLVARRGEMDPEAFRRLADAFDQKVQLTRRTQEQKLREINEIGDTARREFLEAADPILQEIMIEAGAGAILEKSTVFLSSASADITQLAIARINAVLGDGIRLTDPLE